ncbi:unnamed protein product, partial [Coccothraustes coccothraustes]
MEKAPLCSPFNTRLELSPCKELSSTRVPLTEVSLSLQFLCTHLVALGANPSVPCPLGS